MHIRKISQFDENDQDHLSLNQDSIQCLTYLKISHTYFYGYLDFNGYHVIVSSSFLTNVAAVFTNRNTM